MLKSIFGSKIRLELLGLFFTNTDKSYYINQVARILDKKTGVIQRDLNILEQENVLQSQPKGNLRYFKVNKAHSLYEEIKSIILKTKGAAGLIKKALSKLKNIKTAFIFGSFATGAQHKDSDIDLMIIGDIKMREVNPIVKNLEQKLQREINYHLYSEEEFNKQKEKSGFLKDVLKSAKIILIDKNNDHNKKENQST